MRILVTGSNGLLGQKLVYALKRRKDIDLVALSRGKNRLKDKDGYRFASVDIHEEHELQKIFHDFRPEAVIHTAAMTNVDQCETLKQDCWKTNVESVVYLTKLCERYNSHLVHVSTDFVFDGLSGPYAETDQPNPVSYYGKSKLEAERIVSQANTLWTIIRTIIIYGVIEDEKRSNLVLWVKRSLEQGKSIQVINDQFRAPTLAEDLASACIESVLKGFGGLFHVSGPETKCILDLAYEVCDCFGLDKSLIVPVSSAVLNQPAKRPPKTGFIIEKARKDLKFNPVSFVAGLEIVKQQLAQTNNKS
jgi:dTDP-4-dehydrorhamnose reductase